MKKQSILSLVALVAIVMLASCNKFEAKKVTLKTQNDSLNYTLGLQSGENIKMYYLKNDSSSKTIIAFMKAIDNAYAGAENKGQLYEVGTQIGKSIKMQKIKGLMGDSTLKLNEKLLRQGLVNGMSGYEKGMTVKEAQEYIQKTMMKIQQEKAPKQPAAPQQNRQPVK